LPELEHASVALPQDPTPPGEVPLGAEITTTVATPSGTELSDRAAQFEQLFLLSKAALAKEPA